jgi:aryl-alcohol dehydrogenase-like predicted oxidoreductase
MRRRALGKTGLKVTQLSLGTWGLSGDGYGPVSEDEQKAVIERARSQGINLFETAGSYGSGRMEALLGEKLGGDIEALFATKLGTDRERSAKRFDLEYLGSAFKRSQERLKREKLDIVLLHNPSVDTLNKGDAVGWLKEQKEKGTVGAWGVSVTTKEAAEAALEQQAQVLSMPYNILHQSTVKELGKRIKAQGTGLLVHSVLLYGLLCGQWPYDKAFDYSDHRRERWTRDELKLRFQHLNAVRPMVGGAVPTMRAAALRFALCNPRVKSVVLGPRSVQQLDQLVREADKPPYLSEMMLGALDNRLVTLGIET